MVRTLPAVMIFWAARLIGAAELPLLSSPPNHFFAQRQYVQYALIVSLYY